MTFEATDALGVKATKTLASSSPRTEAQEAAVRLVLDAP